MRASERGRRHCACPAAAMRTRVRYFGGGTRCYIDKITHPDTGYHFWAGGAALRLYTDVDDEESMKETEEMC